MQLRHKRHRKLVEAWLDAAVLYIKVGDEPFPIDPLMGTGNYDLVEATDAEVQELEASGYLLGRVR